MTRAGRTTSILFRYGTTVRFLAAAVLLVIGVISWIGSEPAISTKTVAIAARDIPSGAAITAADLSSGQDSLGLTTVQPEELIGEITRGPIREGEPVTLSRITPGRSLGVAPGRVVFPLPLPENGMAGMLVAGDVVDVVVASERLSDGEDDQVRTAAAGVEVLAVTGSQPEDVLAPGGSDSAVLLDVNTEQARDLAAIGRSDRISLTLAGR